MLRFFPALLALSLLFPFSGLEAQLRDLDYTKRAERIGNKRFSGALWEAPAASHIQNRTIHLGEWGKQFSPLGQRRSSIAMEARPQRIIQPNVISHNIIDVDRHRFSRNEVDRRNFDRFGTDRQARGFQNRTESFMNAPQHEAIAAARERELNLQDINRFQFRRSRAPDSLMRETIAADPSVERARNFGLRGGR
jgi:hypothetical protein